MKHVNKLATGIFLLSQAVSGAAFAVSVTLSGNNVDYTFDDTLLGLYGPATVAGDTLYFTPVNFRAESLNGAGYALASSTMNIQVTVRDGWWFSNIGLAERGDYLLLGSGSTADVSGQIRVFDVAAPLTDVMANILPSGPLDQSGLPTTYWNAATTVDLSAWTNARTVNVTMQNLLLASTSAAASLALVDKKFVGLTTEVAPIPEAQTYAMMLAGLGLIGWKLRRRRVLTPNL